LFLPSHPFHIFPPQGSEREKFITRQPPQGEKDDYDSDNSWISSGLPSSSSRRRRGEGRGRGGEWPRERRDDVEVDGAKSEIQVESKRGQEWSAEDFPV